jgi:hypothetical protein
MLSLFLSSGGGMQIREEQHGAGLLDAVEVAENGVSRLAVENSLGDANPLLSDWERERIADAVIRSSRRYDLDPELVTAVMLVESDARPWAHSPKGAVGLMQVMPHMMQPMELVGNASTIESNIEAGCHILANNIRRLGVERGISAYFWGSQIRGVAYLEKVMRARERVRGLRPS